MFDVWCTKNINFHDQVVNPKFIIFSEDVCGNEWHSATRDSACNPPAPDQPGYVGGGAGLQEVEGAGEDTKPLDLGQLDHS